MLVLYVEELPALLNVLCDEVLSVEIPHLRAEVLRVSYSTGKVCYLGFEELKFLAGMARSLGLEPRYVSDSLLLDALHSAGVLRPRNFHELVDAARRLRLTLLEEPRLAYLAIDTNVLYSCTLTHLSKVLREKPAILVSSCVIREVSSAFLSPVFLDEVRCLRRMGEARGAPRDLLKGIESFYGLRARRGLAALRELYRVRNVYPTRISACKGRGDRAIVDDYLYCARSANVLFVTHDRNLEKYASANGLRTLLLEPPEPKVDAVPIPLLSELLYHLAVNFYQVKVLGERGWALLRSWWRECRAAQAFRGALAVDAPEHLLGRIKGELELARRVRSALEPLSAR